MKSSKFPLQHSLQIAACLVIVLWGIRTLSSVLGPLLLSLMLAYAVVPFPIWLMERFKLSKRRATTATAIALVAAGVPALFILELSIGRLAARTPIFEEHWTTLFDQITLLISHFRFLDLQSMSFANVVTADRVGNMIMSVVPQASGVASEILLICLLSALLVIEMLPESEDASSGISSLLLSQGTYATSYIVVTAKSAGINALINFVFLIAMGVETPFLWCVLYFFLTFIPFVGSAIAMVPPILLALLMLGWKRALIVAGVLILVQLIVQNVVMPIIAKKSMNISFLEITLSLVGWTFLLGLPGAIAAIPLTLVLKGFIANKLGHNDVGEPTSA
jgi:AI-2 transport protein TqsA